MVGWRCVPESGLFLGRKAPYPAFIPNPTAAFPSGLNRRSTAPRPVLGGRDPHRGRALWFLTPPLTRGPGQSYLASDPFPRGCQPHNRFITKDADSKWRALRRRGDPGIDIPDSLPRTTRVGSLPRKKGTVPFVHPEPERGLPYGVGPSEPCIKTGARWAGQEEGTSSLVSIYHISTVVVKHSFPRAPLQWRPQDPSASCPSNALVIRA